LEIIKKYVFNKNKKDTIILIHGLYTSSGFWLSFFRFFKNYRIIAFDINYEKLLRSEYNRELLKASFEVDGHIVGVISHSFGTVISDLVFDYENDRDVSNNPEDNEINGVMLPNYERSIAQIR